MRNWICLLVLSSAIVSCSQNNVTNDNSLERFFTDNHVKGSFGLFSNGNGQFTIYNLSRFKDSTYLPASTFDIVNSLIGLETGEIRDEKMVIKWDGDIRNLPSGQLAGGWNKDLTMEEAFKSSAVPYFQQTASAI